jgi:hypothetical protein
LEAVPPNLWLGLLTVELRHNRALARRVVLASLLWREACLSAEGLMARTRALAGADCFGTAATAAFRRDMRAVKAALASSGYHLAYARRRGSQGYYIADRPSLAPEVAAAIQGAAAEVDRRQIEIARRLAPAVRLQQAGRLSDGLRRMAVERLRQRRPGLTLATAHREVLSHYHGLGG